MHIPLFISHEELSQISGIYFYVIKEFPLSSKDRNSKSLQGLAVKLETAGHNITGNGEDSGKIEYKYPI